MVSILVRYGEIALKGKRRKWFEDLLLKNIREGLKGNIERVIRYPGRIILEVKNENAAVKKLSKIFGIKSFSIVRKVRFDSIETLVSEAENYFKEKVAGKRFKVECNRVGKHDFTSYDVKNQLGSALSKYGKVDVKNPEIICWVEIRDNNAYFFDNFIPGPGGLPLGSEGEGIVLISGGFDSPVASWYSLRRGMLLDFLHFNLSGTKIEEYYVLRVIFKLLDWTIGYEPKIFFVDSEKLVKEIMENVDPRYWMVVFRKFMYKFVEENFDAKAIITGESLGQKASQTLQNIYVEEYSVNVPIFRPLIGFDKDEIIKKSMELGFYDFSKEVPEFCSFLAPNPITKAELEKVNSYFDKIRHLLKNLKVKVYYGNEIQKILGSLEKEIRIFTRDLDKIKNRKRIRVDDLTVEELMKILDPNEKYVLYCKEGLLAAKYSEILIKRGYDVLATDERTIRKLE